MQKRVLVTGGKGFVARPLSVELYKRGYAAVASVRSPGDEVHGVHQFIVPSIDQSTNWRIALDGVNVVVHLAARVHIMQQHSSNLHDEFRKTNLYGTLNLARQAAKLGVKRFIYVSSIKVNGEFTLRDQFFTELDVPAPQDSYAFSKLEAELALRELSNETGMEVVIIRPTLIYGVGVKANFLKLISWLKRGLPLPLGRIHNKRSLLGLDNFLDFLLLCIEHPAAANETFLVSDGEDVSTTELLRRMSLFVDKPGLLIPIPSAILNVIFAILGRRDLSQRLIGSLQVDISKARDLLGWDPPNTLDEGLRRMMIEK